ncbi:MAG TPA: CsgG/HfaB family protein [Burkholderiales bacterium]|nr:CsgG/HfaB family protein [Burkholderiales bacterium]
MSLLTRLRLFLVLAAAALLGGCAGYPVDAPAGIGPAKAKLSPATESRRDLIRLPPPKGRVIAAVYGFRDQTGQYKPSPDSSFSTAVTQGAGSILVKALKDSGWFMTVERENLQNLLTERRIIRAADTQQQESAPQLAALLPASILIEGGIVGYESNVKTGGAGARYLGIGLSGMYRTDQVTVVLRAVDIRSGRILNSVSTTKAIYSYQMGLNVFKFVRYKELLEMEVGYTRNEPAQLCVTDAIEAAVIHLIIQGVQDKSWSLRDPEEENSEVFQAYVQEQKGLIPTQVQTDAKTAN